MLQFEQDRKVADFTRDSYVQINKLMNVMTDEVSDKYVIYSAGTTGERATENEQWQ